MRFVTSKIALLLGLWIASTSALVGACDGIFRPADPEPPSRSGSVVVHVDYSTPSEALATMARGLAAKDPLSGLDAYVGALADESRDGVAFSATFDPEVGRQYEQSSGRQVPDWTLALERNFYRTFIGIRSEGYLMQWTPNESRGNDLENAPGDSTLFRKYQVFVVGEDGSTQGLIAVGTADVNFREVTQGRWVMTLWDDRVDPDVGIDPADPEQLSFSKRRLDTQ